MSHPRRIFLALFCLATVLLNSGCMFGQGGGSETTVSGLTGKVVDASGAPVAGAAVHVRLEDALPANLFSLAQDDGSEAPQARTGNDGSFLITGLPAGAYLLECRGGADGAALLAADIPAKAALVHLPDAVLHPSGVIRGSVAVQADSFFQPVPIYAYIPGLGIRDIVSEKTGYRFLLAGVPAGTYTLRLQPVFSVSLSKWNALEIHDVEVKPGDTLNLDSLVLPFRSDVNSPAYSLDSAAVRALYVANLLPGLRVDPNWVSMHSGVTGNRITMLYNFGPLDQDTAGPGPGLYHITRDIQALDQLESIYLFGTDSGAVFTAAPEFFRLPHLKGLWLYNFGFDSVPDSLLGFPELASLEISAAHLPAFPEKVVDVPFLNYLDLSENDIPSIPAGIQRANRLRVLDLSGNQLTSIPKELMEMPSLKGVHLRRNHLCHLSADEKAWIGRQDSLWIAQANPLAAPPDTVGWEADQNCGP